MSTECKLWQALSQQFEGAFEGRAVSVVMGGRQAFGDISACGCQYERPGPIDWLLALSQCSVAYAAAMTHE